jgi:hypothetical protein
MPINLKNKINIGKNMRRILLFFLIAGFLSCDLIGQTKKEQILNLEKQIDSLNYVLTQTRLTSQRENASWQLIYNNLNDKFILEKNENKKIKDSYKNHVDELNTEVNLLKLKNDSISEKLNLISQLENFDDLDTTEAPSLVNYLVIKKQILNSSASDMVKYKIINSMFQKYFYHLLQLEKGSVEYLSMSIDLINSNYIVLTFHEEFFGGAHPVQGWDQLIFDLNSGEVIEIVDLVKDELVSDLVMKLNIKLKEVIKKNLRECGAIYKEVGGGMKFTEDDIKFIYLTKSGFNLTYTLPYAIRACEPFCEFSSIEIGRFFVEGLFNE